MAISERSNDLDASSNAFDARPRRDALRPSRGAAPGSALARMGRSAGGVFCSEVGTVREPCNVERAWQRVRRRAQKRGVGELGARGGEECAVGRRRARSRGPVAHAARLRAGCAKRNPISDSPISAPLGGPCADRRCERQSQRREFVGAPGGIRTPDPQVRSQREGADSVAETGEEPVRGRTEPD